MDKDDNKDDKNKEKAEMHKSVILSCLLNR